MGLFLFSGATPALSAPAAPLPSYVVTLTAYNAVPAQTDDDPLITASGAFSNPEIVAARSRDLADELPFGTIIEIKGSSEFDNSCGYKVVAPLIGYRVIADTMNAKYTNYIDVLFSTKSNYIVANGSTKNASTILGNCDGVSVSVIGHIDLAHSHMPKTQAELVALVKKGTAPLAINK